MLLIIGRFMVGEARQGKKRVSMELMASLAPASDAFIGCKLKQI